MAAMPSSSTPFDSTPTRTGSRRKFWWILIALLLVACLVWVLPSWQRQAAIGSAYGARMGCACRYIEGRPLASAVGIGWKRAKRTILASKAVNVLAAVVLYIVAVGNVRGFAFTLGLTAIIDLLVVYGLTHPVLVLLSRTRFFADGHRLSGLDPSLLGVVPLYRGAGRVRSFAENAESNRGKKNARASVEAAKRMTIAERRRAEAAGNQGAGTQEENNE